MMMMMMMMMTSMFTNLPKTITCIYIFYYKLIIYYILNLFRCDDYEESAFKDPFHPYYDSRRKFSNLTSKHVFVLGTAASHSGSWGEGSDIWYPVTIEAKSADYVASMLEIPDVTGDLLFKYVLDYLKPTLTSNGEAPLKDWVNKLKIKGAIPIEPKEHLWYHAWNYKLNRKSNH
jgi:hypothetical protein